jgi:hypothetical protein
MSRKEKEREKHCREIGCFYLNGEQIALGTAGKRYRDLGRKEAVGIGDF